MYEYAATLVSVHDGDTLHLDVDLGFHLWRRGERYRLARINAPELSTAAGKASAAAVVALLAVHPVVRIVSRSVDNYGRWLAEVFLDDGTNLSDWALANGWAVPYP